MSLKGRRIVVTRPSAQAEGLAELIRQADEKLFLAKNQGRNRVVA